MKTKEEILEDQFYTSDSEDRERIFQAMEEYAQQTAMEFAEWIEKNCVALSYRTWEKITEPDSDCYTTEQLFALFDEERSAK